MYYINPQWDDIDKQLPLDKTMRCNWSPIPNFIGLALADMDE